MPLVRTSLMEYFKKAVEDALADLQIEIDELTAFYVVNLLTYFFRTEYVYHAAEDLDKKALAQVFLESRFYDLLRRIRALKHIADYSLFIAGFFAESFRRKLVDIDYFITLGSRAYLDLAEILKTYKKDKRFVPVYRELSEKFPSLVDVLSEISEKSISTRQDLLRLYERWLRTGSRWAQRKLHRRGILPLEIDLDKLQ